MKIGDWQEFEQGQLSKVERRKKEEERIKKGIYRMHVMIEDQCAETLTEENEKSRKQADSSLTEENEEESEKKKNRGTDIQVEMKKMIAPGSGNISLRQRIW